MDDEIPLTGGDRSVVSRRGTVVLREAGPWSSTVLRLLKHLEEVGFAGAPRVVASGFDAQGRETVSFIEGEVVHPAPWRDDALPAIGRMLRDLHTATASLRVPPEATWRPWSDASSAMPVA